jgi:hypothetical protein
MSKSHIDAVAGHQLTNAAGLAAAAVAGPALAAAGLPPGAISIALLGIVPGLVQTAVAARHQERIEATIAGMQQDATALATKLETLTEAQYMLANECVMAVATTIDQTKLDYLRAAFRNSLSDKDVAEDTPELLSRLIRNMSAKELCLVDKLFRFGTVCIAEEEMVDEQGYIAKIGTHEAMQVGALIQLGLLHSLAPSWDVTRYAWSPVTAKLLALVRN